MKTMTSILGIVLFATVIGVSMPSAFADHYEATVTMAEGSGVMGCEETEEGCYIPTEVSINLNGEVTWVNTDSAAHTVTSGLLSDDNAGELFNSNLMLANSEFSVMFTEEEFTVGDYPYFCAVHPWMVGVVTVVAEHDDEEPEPEVPEPEPEPEVPEPEPEPEMRENANVEGMLSDERMVIVEASAPTEGETMMIKAMFEGAEHANYDIVATQNGQIVLEEMGAHSHDGQGSHQTDSLSSNDPVDISITFQGYGLPDSDKTGPIGEQVVFSNIVPEFGTIAIIVLSVAIMSIIAITSRNRILVQRV